MVSAIKDSLTILSLAQRDRNSIWHPFTQMQTSNDCIPIMKGKGSLLYSEDGSSYIDAISSWWVNLHGHTHPFIIEKMQAQMRSLEHVIFADFTHQPSIELAETLLSILPGKMSKIFYSDNGSTAVEVSIKMAIQYFFNLDPHTKRKKIICFKGGYHGDTFGAMSAAGKNEFTRPFWSHFFEVEVIDPPLNDNEIRTIEQLTIILNKEDVACFIFEPLILASGGMVIYSATCLDRLLELCHHHGVITIADEVMTGFGRTGSLFACDKLKEKPDIICLAKGLTGGFLPLGVTSCKEFIYQVFLSDKKSHAFLHGHSYTGNPIACSAALASLELLQMEECLNQRIMITKNHAAFCLKWKSHSRLKRCESLGTILVLEYRTEEVSSYFNSLQKFLYHFFLEQGILLRPLGNVLYMMPPYCITKSELEYIYDRIILSLEKC